MNIFFSMILVLISCVTRASIQTNDPSLTNSNFLSSTSKPSGPRGFNVYFAAAAGYGDSSGSTNDKAEGVQSALKILGSYISAGGRGVFDAGFGILNHQFVHGIAADKSKSAPLLELASRFQFKNQWQLGVAFNQAFNVGKNFYANQSDVQFVGVQIIRQFPVTENIQGRIGGRFMNGFNIENEVFNMMMFDLQLSIPTF